MIDALHLYAFDIETDNEAPRNGLDPFNSVITEIAVATDSSICEGGMVFTGTEEDILGGFGDFLADLEPGLVAGWNSSFFDIPFIATRERLLGIETTGMRPIAQPELLAKYDPLPGSVTDANPGGGYTAVWPMGPARFHSHLDVSQAYRRFADEQHVKWSLKPVCAAQGIDMVELDRTRLHDYTPAQRKAYVLSDGHGTRELALRLLGLDYTPYR